MTMNGMRVTTYYYYVTVFPYLSYWIFSSYIKRLKRHKFLIQDSMVILMSQKVSEQTLSRK